MGTKGTTNELVSFKLKYLRAKKNGDQCGRSRRRLWPALPLDCLSRDHLSCLRLKHKDGPPFPLNFFRVKAPVTAKVWCVLAMGSHEVSGEPGIAG